MGWSRHLIICNCTWFEDVIEVVVTWNQLGRYKVFSGQHLVGPH